MDEWKNYSILCSTKHECIEIKIEFLIVEIKKQSIQILNNQMSAEVWWK